MSKSSTIYAAAALLLLLCLSCAQEEKGQALARVGDYVITEQTLQDRTKAMPPFMQQQLATPEGRERFLDALVEEEIIVREARERGLADTPEFEQEMAQRERDLLVRLFYEKVVQAEAVPPDSVVVEYYEAHRQDYAIPEHAVARHIQTETREQALDLRKRIESGADFGEIAREYSVDERSSKRDGLLQGRIERDVPIRGLGDIPELNQAIFSLEVGKVSDPIKTSLGYHLVKVDERKPEEISPLEEVNESIKNVLTNARREGARDRIVADLKDKYDVVYFTGSGEEVAETPEGLFKAASEESDPDRKIEYYRKFVDMYPDNERAYEAKFMIGFTLAEDIKDFDEAEQIFREFLQEYPDNDLTDDANWMLANMRSGEQPDFAPE